MDIKKTRYDYNRMRRDIQDEYLAAMLVGSGEDTPDLMDIQMAPHDALPEVAERLGFSLEEYIIKDDDDNEQ